MNLSAMPTSGIILAIILCVSAVSSQDSTNYLVYAHETAMNMLFTVKTNSNTQTNRLTEEVDLLSLALTDRIADKLEDTLTQQQGYQIQGCILQVSTMALSVVWDVHDQLEYVYNESVDFHQSVIREIMDKDMLQIDFEHFYYEFMEHLYERYYHLNDALVEVDASIQGLVAAKAFLMSMVDNCLGGVKMAEKNNK